MSARVGRAQARGRRGAQPAYADDQPVAPSRRAFMRPTSASGVVTGREQVWPWQSIAIGSSARGRSSRGEPFGHSRRSRRSTVSDGSGARSATAASAWRRRIVERPVDDDRAAARQHVGAHERQRTAAEPLGRAGDRADEAFGRLAPARFVGQMPEAHERLGEKPDAGRRRPVMRLTRARARHVGGVLAR